MRAIDTNVLVRLITGDDAPQVAAAERFIQQGAWVPLLAVAETTWVLKAVYDFTPRQIADVVEMLIDQHHLVLEDEDVVAGALELFRGRPALGFSDCLMLQVSINAGHTPLGTFDRNLAKVDGAQKV